VLLLGPGMAGKSTLLKQIKLIHGSHFPASERQHYIFPIHKQIIQGMKHLVEHRVKCDDDPTFLALANEVAYLDPNQRLSVEDGQIIDRIWKQHLDTKQWDGTTSLVDVASDVRFFATHLSRITHPKYIPTHQDLLYLRNATYGLQKAQLTIEHKAFEFYDVGGQRCERRKWIHYFQNVHAVIYVAAIGEYDLSLPEKPSLNRMVDAIELFGEICNSEHLTQSAMVIFLNKIDLFEQKMKTLLPSRIPEFSDFCGKLGDVQLGFQYFTLKFLSLNKNPKRKIYVHLLCGIDTNNVKLLFRICAKNILKHHMKFDEAA